jgi:hypothetical protein
MQPSAAPDEDFGQPFWLADHQAVIRSHSPRVVSQPSILSATACHPGSNCMQCPVSAKNSASV